MRGVAVLVAAACVACMVVPVSSKLHAAAPGATVVVTSDNYESVLTSTPVTVAFFHDPNNAKNEEAMHKELATAAALLKNLVTVGRIDVNQKSSAALIDMFKIDDTPAVRIVRQGGQIIKFEGNITARELVYGALTQWRDHNEETRLEKENAPAVYKLDQAIEVAQLLRSGSTVCIGFYAQKDENSTSQQIFHRASKLFRGAVVFAEANETLSKALNVTNTPAVSLYNPEVGTLWFSGEWVLEGFAKWVDDNGEQYFTHLTNDNWEDFNRNKDGRAAAVLMANMSDPTATNWILSLRPVAVKYAQNISFWHIDIDAAAELSDKFGLSKTAQRKFAIWSASNRQHYNFQPTKPITKASLDLFCAEYSKGTLPPTLKSAPRPQQSEGAIVEVVCDTFREVVEDPTADVVVLLYDSSSKEAEVLLETYKEIAVHISSTDGIVVAAMDVLHNDLPPGANPEVPSITLYPNKGKDTGAISYQGAVRYNNIVDWLAQHASVSVDGPDPPTADALPKHIKSALDAHSI